jgi:hypothetical protein
MELHAARRSGVGFVNSIARICSPNRSHPADRVELSVTRKLIGQLTRHFHQPETVNL